MKKWMQKRNKADIEKMSEALNVSPTFAQVLANRGIGTYSQAKNFIEADIENMYDGYLFKDMEKGIKAVSEAVDKGVKISVYGDYDADGVMSSVILYKTLKRFTDNVVYYVPHRQKEGYGINLDSIEELYKDGVGLILTCDNGIAAIEEAKRIKELGMTLIILDHHEPAFMLKEDGTREDVIPVAHAVIDHKQKDCDYPFKELCAGAMAYKFSKLFFEQRMEEEFPQKEFLTFAAIATICDIVDLRDENRIIAKNGLRFIKDTENIGLKALLKQTGIENHSITEYHVGFIIGPCINATGRLESAEAAIELFTTENKERAEFLAQELSALNDERKFITQKGTAECFEAIENSPLCNDRVLVIYNDNIHESIAGIVAGRVKEKYYKPTIVITRSEEMAKGSARSIEGYNIFEELLKQRDLFHKFGGHPMAAGLSLLEENIDVLRKRLNDECLLTKEEMTPVLRIEKALEINEINLDLAQELLLAAPFGKDNPSPIFGTKSAFAEKVFLIGKNKNILKMSLRDTKTGTRVDAVDFGGYECFMEECVKLYGEEKAENIIKGLEGIKLDIVYSISINSYMGMDSVSLHIKDFRL